MSEIITITKLRKGSKRLVDKNILPFLGKELWEHTKDFALKLEYPYYIITDYDHIEPDGFEVYQPRGEYFTDNHRTNEAILDLIDQLEEKPKYIILLQATSPVRDWYQAIPAIERFLISDKDCLVTGIPINALTYTNGKKNYKNRDYNRATKKPVFAESGSIYMFKTKQLKKKHITDGKLMFATMTPFIDINTEADYKALVANHEN